MIEDWRHIENGWEIPTDYYSDQPYVVKTDDGAWLCTLTTGAGREGASGQHVVCLRSEDRGRSWSKPVRIESPEGPEASYAVLLKVPGGRVYCLYNYNADNIREIKGDPHHAPDMIVTRVDSLGHYVFRYSDDHGRSWSQKRYEIPVREFAIDRENVYQGSIRFFWNVGRPLVRDDAAYCSLHKVGGFGDGFFIRSEGVLLKSRNILTERDPERIVWETVPDGDVGIRTPEGGGLIAEEHSYTTLSDGSIYTIFRTIDGYPGYAISRDGGHTFGASRYLRFGDGRLVKHPRAANFVWRCENGRFLYWFHHHGGRFTGEGRKRYGGGFPYEDRNPVWISAGEECQTADGASISWSEPEIVLYDDDPLIRMSYPDLVEDGGEYYLTETQKDLARVHAIDPGFLDTLFSQSTRDTVAASGCLLEWRSTEADASEERAVDQVDMPALPRFLERDTRRADHGSKDNRSGLTFEIWFRLVDLDPGQTILDWTDDSDRGIVVRTSERKSVEILFGDGFQRGCWDTDAGSLHEDELHHLAFVFDGGPRILSLVVDGRVQDGGDARQFGWCRFSPTLRGCEGAEVCTIGADFRGEVVGFRIYDRALLHTECIGNYRAGPEARVEGK